MEQEEYLLVYNLNKKLDSDNTSQESFFGLSDRLDSYCHRARGFKPPWGQPCLRRKSVRKVWWSFSRFWKVDLQIFAFLEGGPPIFFSRFWKVCHWFYRFWKVFGSKIHPQTANFFFHDPPPEKQSWKTVFHIPPYFLPDVPVPLKMTGEQSIGLPNKSLNAMVCIKLLAFKPGPDRFHYAASLWNVKVVMLLITWTHSKCSL